jgi:anti-repressor protein
MALLKVQSAAPASSTPETRYVQDDLTVGTSDQGGIGVFYQPEIVPAVPGVLHPVADRCDPGSQVVDDCRVACPDTPGVPPLHRSYKEILQLKSQGERNMYDLIKIHTDNDGKRTVNARELHEFLGSKQEFSHWIKSRIKQYDFTEGIDFTGFDNFIKAENVHKTLKEYHITIDMAKELSMVERNEKGKMARLYFLECERKAKDQVAMQNDPVHLRKLLHDACGQVIELKEKNSQLLTKARFADAITASDTTISVGGLAKLLRQNGVRTGQNKLYQWFRDNGYVHKREGTEYNLPTQKPMDLEIMEINEKPTFSPSGQTHISRTTCITGKGQVYFVDKFLNNKRNHDDVIFPLTESIFQS